MTCGIYLLSFDKIPQLYVGQSINIEERYKQHIRELRAGTHTKKLQRAFINFGMPYLEIIEVCEPQNLDAKELYHIQFWNTIEDGYNNQPHAEGAASVGEDNGMSLYTNEKIIELIETIVNNPNTSLV